MIMPRGMHAAFAEGETYIAVPESLRLCNEQSSRRLHGGKN